MLPHKAVSFKTDTLGMLSSQKMCRIFHNSSLWITLRVPGTCFLTFSVVTTLQSLRTGFENVKQTEKKMKSYPELSLKNTVIIALLEPHLRCAYSIKNMIFPPFLPLSLPSFFPLPLLLPFLLLLLLLVLLFFFLGSWNASVKRLSKMFSAWKIYKINKYSSKWQPWILIFWKVSSSVFVKDKSYS